ncbi:MAG: hypothetical protein JRJ83_08780, partial [Deltaproteobacteria bacterium]|nr:hypothetical protein [Deltaproteobacteria bacterium]
MRIESKTLAADRAKDSQRQKNRNLGRKIETIKFLEKSREEVEVAISQELELNPLLEEHSGEAQENQDRDIFIEGEGIEYPNYSGSRFNFNGRKLPLRGDASDFDSAETTFMYNNRLYFHLNMQVAFNRLNVVQEDIARFLIGNIDEDGYLKMSVEEVCQHLRRYLPETVEETIKLIQKFDPIGVASKGHRECLLTQLRSPRGLNRSLCERILKEHWEDFLNRKNNRISKSLGVSEQKVEEAIRFIIARLNPRPALHFNDRIEGYSLAAFHIGPDVYVKQENGDYKIIPVKYSREPVFPKQYDELLENGSLSKEEREYIQQNKQKAIKFLWNIETRRRLICETMKIVVDMQRDFFDTGLMRELRPFISSDVAPKVGVDESTIRRLARAKYVDTPHGLFQLRFFFDKGSLNTLDGKKVSSTGVKELISRIIKLEDKENPYTDGEITEILRDQYRI